MPERDYIDRMTRGEASLHRVTPMPAPEDREAVEAFRAALHRGFPSLTDPES